MFGARQASLAGRDLVLAMWDVSRFAFAYQQLPGYSDLTWIGPQTLAPVKGRKLVRLVRY